MDGLDMRPVYLPVSLYLALSHMHTLLTFHHISAVFTFFRADGMAGAYRYAPSLCGERQKHTKMCVLVCALHVYEGSTKRLTFSRSPFATAGTARLMCLNVVRRASLPLNVCVAPLPRLCVFFELQRCSGLIT